MSEPRAPEASQKNEKEPKIIDEQDLKEAQQEALVVLMKKFAGTPLERIFTDEEFEGTIEYNSAMGRNYRAIKISNQYGDEIIFQAFIKPSDHSKGNFLGDEIRIKRPSVLGAVREFDYVIHQKDGIVRKAPANTDLSTQSGLEALKNLPRLK